MRTPNKKTTNAAIGMLDNTMVDISKIADHFGFRGEITSKFCVFAKKRRKELWAKIDAMTEEEKIAWARQR